MPHTAAEAIAQTLKAYGVAHVFGMKDPIDLYAALKPLGIAAVTVRDEKHGAIMAHGYAKASRRPGICTAMCGPAATNLVTGLLEALQSSIPVIAFVLDIAASQRGRHAASELDQDPVLAPVAKHVLRIDVADRAAEITRHAFRIATSGRPGPVVVMCPRDVMGRESAGEIYADEAFSRYPSMRSRAAADAVAAAAGIILSAERPVIVAGGGVHLSDAAADVVALAETLGVPVATTMNGRGVIADENPLSLGALGSSTAGQYGRGQVANAALAEADVALVLGSRCGQITTMDWTLPARETRVLQVDIDPVEIGRNFRVDVALAGDVRETVRDLAAVCADTGGRAANPAQLERVGELRAAWADEFATISGSQQVPIRPERLLSELSEAMQPDDLLVTDASYVTGWAFSHVDTFGQGRPVISPRGTGGLGWGLPAAIGARLAHGCGEVICLTGDGGFGYVLGELETAARIGAKVIVIVFNNATLAFQKHVEEKLLGEDWACDLLDVDHAALAATLGWAGERVARPAEIATALANARGSEKPYLIDVVIDPQAIAPIVSLTEPGAVLSGH